MTYIHEERQNFQTMCLLYCKCTHLFAVIDRKEVLKCRQEAGKMWAVIRISQAVTWLQPTKTNAKMNQSLFRPKMMMDPSVMTWAAVRHDFLSWSMHAHRSHAVHIYLLSSSSFCFVNIEGSKLGKIVPVIQLIHLNFSKIILCVLDVLKVLFGLSWK